MKVGKIVKFTLVTFLVLGLLSYVVYAMLFLSGPDEEERCTSIELMVEKNSESDFVNEKEVEDILKNANVYPKGMLMKDVDAEHIEDVLRKNEFIANVECYKSVGGRFRIKVEQRIPVIFVIPEGRDGFFVDAQGHIIPNRNSATDLVVASGNIDNEYASKELAKFGQFLQTEEFWDNQIEQIYVSKNKKGQRVVELIPRVGDQVIYLGVLDDYQKKLRNLRRFYDKAVDKVGWNKYARISLEYEGQIICTKR